MGAALTQRPDLFRAVVSYVGIYDMLRVELDPNGAFNVTEFGTVKDPEQFKALYAYSPYHHVKDGTAYPAILFPTGENDHRVNPMQSRKMTARLQAATSSGRPILLRTSSNAGHGIGTAARRTDRRRGGRTQLPLRSIGNQVLHENVGASAPLVRQRHRPRPAPKASRSSAPPARHSCANFCAVAR